MSALPNPIFQRHFANYIRVLCIYVESDKTPPDTRLRLMDRIEGLIDQSEKREWPYAEAEYQSWLATPSPQRNPQ